MKTKPETTRSRREFLKNAAIGVGAAAVAGKALSAGKASAKTVFAPDEEGAYRETEHVKRYYEIARN